MQRGPSDHGEDHAGWGVPEQLETDPAKYLPETTDDHLPDDSVAVNLDRPMTEIRAQLSRYPVKTRLALSGTMVVARDIAHA